MRDKPEMVAITQVGTSKLALTGGALRAGRSLKEYSKYFNVYLMLPPTFRSIGHSDLDDVKSELKTRDVIALDTYLKPILTSHPLRFTYLLTPLKTLGLVLKGLEKLTVKPSVVAVLDETPECLRVGSLVKEKFESPALALLQLPLFYHEKKRRENISRALKLWYKELYRGRHLDRFVKMYLAKLRMTIEQSRLMRNTLRNYEMLVAVSKAIPYEMGPEWINRIQVLDPGVSLDDEDLELIYKTKKSTNKEDYVVLGGRVDALKGFIEGLYVFRELVRHDSSLKLIVTGHVSNMLKARIERLLRRIGLDRKVVLTGTLPRSERFRVVASAKLMIYPSHVDAFPYTILESLYLDTPVVAYDIPALRIYYGDNPGVRLVEEGNIEALTTEAFNLLESKNIDIEQPKLRRWEDILKEELMLINKLIDRG